MYALGYLSLLIYQAMRQLCSSMGIHYTCRRHGEEEGGEDFKFRNQPPSLDARFRTLRLTPDVVPGSNYIAIECERKYKNACLSMYLVVADKVKCALLFQKILLPWNQRYCLTIAVLWDNL